MKKVTFFCLLLLLTVQLGFSQANTISAGSTNYPASFTTDLIQGLESYKMGNWTDALFFLRKTASFPHSSSEEVWYLIIMAEINLKEYTSVLRDGNAFIKQFPNSNYVPEIVYQKNLAYFGLAMYDEVIFRFSKFIEQYPNNTLVPSALFWTAEALYQSYEFERARVLYELIISDYQNSPKYADSVFRLELLMQREREEKLLHLLRVTGEESGAVRDDYERQLKEVQSEEIIILNNKLGEVQSAQSQLELDLVVATQQNKNLENRIGELVLENTKLRTPPMVEKTTPSPVKSVPEPIPEEITTLNNKLQEVQFAQRELELELTIATQENEILENRIGQLVLENTKLRVPPVVEKAAPVPEAITTSNKKLQEVQVTQKQIEVELAIATQQNKVLEDRIGELISENTKLRVPPVAEKAAPVEVAPVPEEITTSNNKLEEVQVTQKQLEVELALSTQQNKVLEDRIEELISENTRLRMSPTDPPIVEKNDPDLVEVVEESVAKEIPVEIPGEPTENEILMNQLNEKARQLQNILDNEEGY